MVLPGGGLHVLPRLLLEKVYNKFLSKTTKPRIWYVSLSSRPLPSAFKVFPWGQKWPPRGHMFNLG